MINSISYILNQININNYFLKKNKFFKNDKLKNDNIISSTSRALNNPPKKTNSEDSKTEKDDNNTDLEKDLVSDDTKKSDINNEKILDIN